MNQQEFDSRVKGRLDAIKAAYLIANAEEGSVADANGSETFALFMGKLDHGAGQPFRTLIARAFDLKGAELSRQGIANRSGLRDVVRKKFPASAVEPKGAFTAALGDPQESTAVIVTPRLASEMRKEIDAALNLKKIPVALMLAAQTPSERAENLFFDYSGQEKIPAVSGAADTIQSVSINMPSVIEKKRDDFIALLHSEVASAGAAGLKDLIPLELSSLHENNTDTTQVILDKRIYERMIARIKTERQAIDDAARGRWSEAQPVKTMAAAV